MTLIFRKLRLSQSLLHRESAAEVHTFGLHHFALVFSQRVDLSQTATLFFPKCELWKFVARNAMMEFDSRDRRNSIKSRVLRHQRLSFAEHFMKHSDSFRILYFDGSFCDPEDLFRPLITSSNRSRWMFSLNFTALRLRSSDCQ